MLEDLQRRRQMGGRIMPSVEARPQAASLLDIARKGTNSFMNYQPLKQSVSVGDIAKFGTNAMPFVGDAIAIEDAKNEYQKGNMGMAAFNAATALPVIGDIGAAAKMSLPAIASLGGLYGMMSRGAKSLPSPTGAIGRQRGIIGGSDLPMDEASRMARAKEMGFDIPAYHASTHDIEKFDLSKANPESDMGAGIYTTNSPYDASTNYSDLTGADLTQRIELRAEQIDGELDSGMDAARELAKKELYGESPNVMPLMGRMERPLVIGGDEATFLKYEQPEYDPKDFLDEAGGDLDIAEDLAREESWNHEPEGELVDLIEKLQWNKYDVDASESIGQLQELAMDGGGASADDVIDILKADQNLMEAYGDTGGMESNELIRSAFEDVGFDGIIDNTVDSKWGSTSGNYNIMEGMDEDTTHNIFFKPNQLRSIFAKFDPAKKDSANILAGMGAGGIGIGALMRMKEEDDKRKGIR